MKKNILIFSITILIIVALTLFFAAPDQPSNYVVYAYSENLNDNLREALIERLETNHIPYQVDDYGNVEIREKDLKKAVMCCS